MPTRCRLLLTPKTRDYAATLTKDGLHCYRSHFYPWSDIEKKVTQFIKEEDRGYKSPCWIWQGNKDIHGYGRIRVQSVYIKSHRLLWITRNGLIPDDLCVCHNCDQPACCRPDHLRLDTSPENIRERTRKGRTAHGATNAHAKLNDDLVREMRSLHPTLNYAQLGRKYGIAKGTARLIVMRVWWKHVP